MKKLSFLIFVLFTSEIYAQSNFSDKPKKQPASSSSKFLDEIPKIDGSKLPQSIDSEILNPKLLSARVVRNEAGSPVLIEYKKSLPASANGKTNLAAASMSYLKELKPLLNLQNPEQEFEVLNIEQDELNQTHIKLQQTFKGINVYGGEIMLHGTDNEINTLNGRHFKTPTLKDVVPNINESQAAQVAQEDLKQRTKFRPLSMGELQLLKKQVSGQELIIYHVQNNETEAHLAWRMTIRPNFLERWVYVIDAKSGEIISKINNTCSIDGSVRATGRDLNNATQNLNVYQSGSNYFMIDITKTRMFNSRASTLPDDPQGVIWTIDARNSAADDLSYHQIASTNNSWNQTAISAHYNSGVVYDYYLTKHGRNSIDGKGGNIISIINVRDEDGKDMDNAFYNGELMAYGNGSTDFTPLAGALDVAAHEMTHGVTESTARLEYDSQSGAINESMSDVIGVLVDRTNWLVGENVTRKSAFPSGALRDMSNPNQGGRNDPGYQPKTMAQYINTSQDNGGVHINSGIPNYAFYLFAKNGSVGRDKAEKVYYRALTTYLTRYSQFLDLRIAIIKATSDLYGASGAEVVAARSAFDQVGITDGGTTMTPTPSKPTTLPTNTGTEFLLVTSTGDKKLYSATIDAKNITAKTTRKIVNRPSVTDDGKLCYYVSEDKRIYAVSLVGTATESVISNETKWNKVAISKDGKKLAALTDLADKTIYVYSFDLAKWNSFVLYNPTYSNTKTSDVQYADGLEWDASGEYLVYDAFNKLNSATGKAVDYWDMGIIKVWNTVDNAFGDGKIQKLFSDLSQGESVGNPAFAKNSTAILSFDYFNDVKATNAVYGMDLQTNAIKTIANNSTLGYPDYSRLDDKTIYVTGSGINTDVSVIGLNADKVSGKGTATKLFTGATWPIWVSQGTRTLPSINFAAISDKFQNTAPFTLTATASTGDPVLYKVTAGPATISGNTLTITGSGTVTVRAYTQPSRVFFPIAVAERSFNVIAILSVNPLLDANTIVYPNPVQDVFTILLPQGTTAEQIEVVSTAGNQLMSRSELPKTNEIQVNVQSFSSGTYHVGIKTNKGMVWKKIVKM